MANDDFNACLKQLDAWHLEFAMTVDLCDVVISQIDCDDIHFSASALCISKLREMVDNFPFPDVNSDISRK